MTAAATGAGATGVGATGVEATGVEATAAGVTAAEVCAEAGAGAGALTVDEMGEVEAAEDHGASSESPDRWLH